MAPDLSVENRWGCCDLDYFQTRIEGSADYTYLVICERGEWHCDCKGFKFRRTCRHIKEAEKKRCVWSEDTDGGEPNNVPVSDFFPNGKSCPKCGGEVFSYRVGV